MPLRELSKREKLEINRACTNLNLVPNRSCLFHRYFRVAPVAQKGQGCIATKDISPDSVIHMERPLFSLDVETEVWSRATNNKFQQALQRLSHAQWQGFQGLVNPYSPALRPDAEKARFEANQFHMTEEDDRGKEEVVARKNIIRLIDLLEEEELIYPHMANLCGELAELNSRELECVDPLAQPRKCREEGLKITRDRLE
ncbi:MAG: hypothetical protein Q9188_002562 [Gyalolechia gomerana]